MSNLKKNLNKILIGFNAIFVVSFFLNWVELLNIPKFITYSSKGLLNVVQITGSVSPAKLIGRVASARQYISGLTNGQNLVPDGFGNLPEGIMTSELYITPWLVAMLVVLIISIVLLVIKPKEKYTAVIAVVSSLYYGGVLTAFAWFIIENNGFSPDITVARPTPIFTILAILAILNIYGAFMLLSICDFTLTGLGESGVKKGLIGLNIIYIVSFFLNWIQIQGIPQFLKSSGEGIVNEVSFFGNYSPMSLIQKLGEANQYFVSNGIKPLSFINNRFGLIAYLVLAIIAVLSLIFLDKQRSLWVGLVSAGYGTVVMIGVFLTTHKYNATKVNVAIAQASPLMLILLILSLLGLIVTAVALAERNRENYGYLFIAPFFIIFFTFLIYPNIQTLIFTFTNKTTATAPYEFIGLDNWARFVQDAQFRTAFTNTWKIWGLNIIIQLGLALVLVFIFYDITWKMKGLGFFRTVFYLPNLITLASVAMLFRILLDWKYGAINQSLVSLGILQEEIGWLTDPFWAQVWVAIIGGWMWFGNSFLFLMAGVQGISRDYFEAAKVDGANRFQMFTKITLPLLRPIMLYVTITSLIGGMQIFEMPQLLTDGLGAPGNGLLTMVLMLYNQYYKYDNMAYASTVAYGLFFVTMFFTVIYYLLVYYRKDKGGVN